MVQGLVHGGNLQENYLEIRLWPICHLLYRQINHIHVELDSKLALKNLDVQSVLFRLFLWDGGRYKIHHLEA